MSRRYKIDDGSGKHKYQTISLCDYNTIFVTNDAFDLIKGVYDHTINDKVNTYNWDYG